MCAVICVSTGVILYGRLDSELKFDTWEYNGMRGLLSRYIYSAHMQVYAVKATLSVKP